MTVQEPGIGSERADIGSDFAHARAILQAAEAEVEQVRAAADRYVRQRQGEADLLVAKARRLLAVAEGKAAALAATAPMGPAAAEPTQVIDLDELSAASRSGRLPSGLDDGIAKAVGFAVDRTFPSGA